MKKRILALLLAFSMMLSLLPVSALADTGGIDSAAYASNGLIGNITYNTSLVITKAGVPDTEGREPIYQDDDSSNPIIGYKGDGWTYILNSVTNEKAF